MTKVKPCAVILWLLQEISHHDIIKGSVYSIGFYVGRFTPVQFTVTAGSIQFGGRLNLMEEIKNSAAVWSLDH